MNDSERRLRQYLYAETNGRNREKAIQMELYQQALSLSQHTTLNLRTIVDALAEHCYKKYKTLSEEFITSFSTNSSVAEILINVFLKKLQAESKLKAEAAEKTADTESPELLSARKDLMDFIRDYAKDTGKTVASFLEEVINLQYPGLDHYRLFNDEVRKLWQDQINDAAGKIVESKYTSLFSSDNKGFILDFIFFRVIKEGERGRVTTDRQALEKLLFFLEEKNFEVEKLYELLYGEFRNMSNIGRNKAWESKGA